MYANPQVIVIETPAQQHQQQHHHQQHQHLGPQPWTSGLFGCFDDCNSCCLTFWCPCIAFGRIAHTVDKGRTSCCGSGSFYFCLMAIGFWQWIYSCVYRKDLRMAHNLPDSPCCDCCVHFLCEPCSLCQMYRELQNRGFDMSKGYDENMKRLARAGVQMPPVVQGGMMR